MISQEVLSWLSRKFSVRFQDLTVDADGSCFPIWFKGAMPFWRGWWMVEIVTSPTVPDAVLNLDVVGRKSKGLSLHKPIGVTGRRKVKRVVRAPWWIGSVRLSVEEDADAIKLKQVTFSPTTEHWALKRIYETIGAHGPAVEHGNPGSLKKKITEEADEAGLPSLELLLRYYDEMVADFETSRKRAYELYQKLIEPGLFAIEAAVIAEGLTVSIILPVRNPEEEHLRQAITSVIEQTYPNWELCIVDDASTVPHVKPLIESFAAKDSRIKAFFCASHNHISKTTNVGLEAASGELVTFLDHDDRLSIHALNEVVSTFGKRPELEILYSDEDLIDEHGNRCLPHFKSDWNPYLFYSHNYVTHLCVYRRRLIEQVGGMREGLEGAQDYDLLLRCVARVDSSSIGHIPKVLYHWRMSATSTASSSSNKSYTHQAGQRALKDFFSASSQRVEVESAGSSNLYRVQFIGPEVAPLTSIIIPTKDNVQLLSRCLESIFTKTRNRNFEVLVIDNRSEEVATRSYLTRIAKRRGARVCSFDEPFNFARICNFGVSRAKGDILALVNNDVEVISENWLDEMVMLASRPDVGCVGAKLYYDDDTIQHAGVIIGLGGYAAHSHRGAPKRSPGYYNRLKLRQNLSAVTGACLVVRKAIYESVNGMDEQLAVAYNDVDFCLRVREAGYLNVFTPFAELYHFESKTRGYEDTPEKQARFQREKAYLAEKWGDQLKSDPYYNRNLTHSREDFSIGLEGR